MNPLKVLLAIALSAGLAIGETPLRIVDTVAELDALYPNIEQPAVLVRGLTVKDDWSPPRLYMWNPDSTTATNNSIRPTIFGVGRWTYLTNVTFEGVTILGTTNNTTTLRVRGANVGSRMLWLERGGFDTLGFGIGSETLTLANESKGRFLFSFAADNTTTTIYGGANSGAGFTNGRSFNLQAQNANGLLTNENSSGGSVNHYSGAGTGLGTLSQIDFWVPVTNPASATNYQVLRRMFQIRHPTAIDVLTNNTGIRIYAYDSATNIIAHRMVITNEGGILRPIFIPEY